MKTSSAKIFFVDKSVVEFPKSKKHERFFNKINLFLFYKILPSTTKFKVMKGFDASGPGLTKILDGKNIRHGKEYWTRRRRRHAISDLLPDARIPFVLFSGQITTFRHYCIYRAGPRRPTKQCSRPSRSTLRMRIPTRFTF